MPAFVVLCQGCALEQEELNGDALLGVCDA